MPIAKKRATEPAFWDASGLVLLAADQRGSARARAIQRDAIVVWWGSRIEVASALARMIREATLEPSGVVAAERRLDAVFGSAFEVSPSEAVRERAAGRSAST
ncbi:MAG: hypothetical protein M3Y87_11950 [Myxococcota bacterium]|nr:hypothetical protein [Myxococcota bacterium]